MSWPVWGVLIGISLIVIAILFMAGCALTGTDEQRDAIIYALWWKRGEIVGDMGHLYCDQGGPREREMMESAIKRSSHPAVVTITCPHE